MGDYAAMARYVDVLGQDSVDGNYLRAVHHLHNGNYAAVETNLENLRQVFVFFCGVRVRFPFGCASVLWFSACAPSIS